jgi:RNA polymerase sigma-70 factor (ECF subfamily)
MKRADEVEALYLECRDDVYRYLVSFGLTPAQAQDATQEAFLRLHQEARRGGMPRHPRAWVFKVAHNAGLAERLRLVNRSVALEPEMEGAAHDPSPSAERLAMERQDASRLRRAIAALSEQQRRCLYLRAEGLRYADIAGALGVGISTVAEFLARATARLKKEMS